jgi:adenosylcobalamin-dependent ribonucleoside-triphosphate reductase
MTHALPDFVVPSGMARAVFQNKYSRRKADGTFQTFVERIEDVMLGNFSLHPAWQSQPPQLVEEYNAALALGRAGVLATSGRHLQHGDSNQPSKIMELFTNCSSAMFSFMKFRLLLRGSGVGRDYSSASCRVDWDHMPNVRLVLDASHPDFYVKTIPDNPDASDAYVSTPHGFIETLRDARHKYDSESENVRWFTVEDSREGWSKVIEILETAAWQSKHKDKLFIFDFSQVRCKGTPIVGLQGRPASGPIPLMEAIASILSLKGTGMKPWKQALYIDHYLAACVHLGGARRAARMATKSWRDRDVIEFIDIKRGGFLWSSNNSILVDQEFWQQARQPQHTHARRVFEAASNAAYFDDTGEPGFINVDLLVDNRDGLERVTGATCIDTTIYKDLHPRTKDMIENVLAHVKTQKYLFIVNPCGEIELAIYGGYCLVADTNLSVVRDVETAKKAVGLIARFLIRTNLMLCEYSAEVIRTNRIGTSLIGIHEFAWNVFGLTFYDMIAYYDVVFGNATDAGSIKAAAFWNTIADMRDEAELQANLLSDELGLVHPHTNTTIKPGGTVGKVFNCTEGAHLPALAYYLRWVQYKKDDPDLVDLIRRGYPVKDVSHRYPEQMVVGFPTKQPIVDLMGDKVVTADDTTPEENFKWLRLLEHFWLGEIGRNNQISYTLKYDKTKVSYQDFMAMILQWQPQIRCCAVMPGSDWKKTEEIYSYVPEQPISADDYHTLIQQIDRREQEAYDDIALQCAGGICPIEPDINHG